MKTKLLCSILAMLMLLSLVACNPGDPHPPADTDASTTPDTTDTFGIEYLYRLPPLADTDLDFDPPAADGEADEAA